MDDQPKDDRQQHSVSFLLEEYKQLGESFLRNEELGERRVNFFITITTAVVAGLAAIWKVSDGGFDLTLIIFGLAAVLLFGIVTVVRIIRRNLVTHEYLRALGRIRRYFTDRDPKILLHLPYLPYDDKPQRTKKWEWADILSLGTGGLVEMVALINSLILGAIGAILGMSFVRCQPWYVFISIGFCTAISAWVAQFGYVVYRYEKGKPKKEDIMFPSQSEMEATLIICSQDPEGVAQKIVALTEIKNYRLLSQETKKIHDIYFDKPDSALKGEKLALRIREIGATQLITLKGPSELSDWGGVKRLEIEKLWCKNALASVREELKDNNIRLPKLRKDFDWANPREVMASLGLQVIQDRETQRQIRNIVVLDDDYTPILAELAIDSVVYNFRDKKILHYEVELESKMRDGANVVKAVSENLVKMFEPALRRWDYGKLATGKAIEKLLNEGALEGLVDGKNKLKLSAYDKIEEYLKKDKV